MAIPIGARSALSLPRGALFCAALSFLAGCQVPRSAPAPARALPVDPQDPGPTYWALPVRQPPGSALDLTPRACGACHPSQYADWETSLHARAASPGYRGQVLSMRPAAEMSCALCHQPAVEQQEVRELGPTPVRTASHLVQSMVEDKWAAYAQGTITLEPNPGFDPEHARHGVTCAACHVRGGVVHGPPPGMTPPEIVDRRAGGHGPVVRLRYFESAEFCAECHQFTHARRAGELPLQNTYAEWKDSPYGQNGVACVFCHMPQRRHLWRGIHDPDMVAGALSAEVSVHRSPDGAEVIATLTLMNQGAGHAMPTYITPRIEAFVQLLDAEGAVVAQASHALHRDARPASPQWKELSDTRLLPLQSVDVVVRAQAAVVRSVRQWVDVDPDYYYRGLFERMLGRGLGDEARALIEEAHRETVERRYVIHDRTETL